MKLRNILMISLICGCLLLTGCQSGQKNQAEIENTETKVSKEENREIPIYYQSDKLFIPQASGSQIEENEDVLYDLSHLDQGYMMVKNKTQGEKMLLQLTGKDGITYTYRLSGDDSYCVIPLTAGDGTYQVTSYVNVEGDQYMMSLDKTLEVSLENEVIPFLYPSQYVNFDNSMEACKLAKELTQGKTEAEAVNEIFNYVTKNISYDMDKAASVESGYLPDIDETLKEKKGICFDYSALMTSMLRSVGIPSRLDIGYAKDIYHAWISVYLSGKGWVNNVMEYDGEEWNLMDPTQASTDYSSGEEYQIKDQDYTLEYIH